MTAAVAAAQKPSRCRAVQASLGVKTQTPAHQERQRQRRFLRDCSRNCSRDCSPQAEACHGAAAAACTRRQAQIQIQIQIQIPAQIHRRQHLHQRQCQRRETVARRHVHPSFWQAGQSRWRCCARRRPCLGDGTVDCAGDCPRSQAGWASWRLSWQEERPWLRHRRSCYFRRNMKLETAA